MGFEVLTPVKMTIDTNILHLQGRRVEIFIEAGTYVLDKIEIIFVLSRAIDLSFPSGVGNSKINNYGLHNLGFYYAILTYIILITYICVMSSKTY